MTNTDKFLSFAIWFCVLGFICYQLFQEANMGGQCNKDGQLFQEANMGGQCNKDGGVVVIASNLTGVCVRRAIESLPD
jgi:hypothetical protein